MGWTRVRDTALCVRLSALRPLDISSLALTFNNFHELFNSLPNNGKNRVHSFSFVETVLIIPLFIIYIRGISTGKYAFKNEVHDMVLFQNYFLAYFWTQVVVVELISSGFRSIENHVCFQSTTKALLLLRAF